MYTAGIASLLILIIIPILMGFIGATYGEDINTINIESESPSVLISIASFINQFTSITIFGITISNPLASFLGDIFVGYSIFPVWFNLILTVIPLLILLRVILSVSG